MEQRTALTAVPEDGALEYIASSCGGDLRKAMNAVEVLFSAGIPQDGKLPLTLADAKEVTQKSALRADRDGDNYYDLLSALHKSIRGSDPDAACHYLARLLEAGQMPSACRRLMCVAAEDVGLAYPQILPIVNACVDMALKLGMPEARLPLADAAVLMATSPKSNSAYLAIDAALDDVRKGKSGDFPRHLQNVHADTYTMEREQGYLYPHNYPNHWVKQQYLPDELVGAHYYEYGPNKLEQAAKAAPAPAAPKPEREAPAAEKEPAPKAPTEAPAEGGSIRPMAQWEGLLSELSRSEPALFVMLEGSRAFISGGLVLIESPNPMLKSLLLTDNIGAKLADLVEETLGQRYRLRITKRENQAVSGQSESALDHILQKAKSENIEVHES